MLGLLCRTSLSVNIYNNFFHIKSSKKRSAPPILWTALRLSVWRLA